MPSKPKGRTVVLGNQSLYRLIQNVQVQAQFPTLKSESDAAKAKAGTRVRCCVDRVNKSNSVDYAAVQRKILQLPIEMKVLLKQILRADVVQIQDPDTKQTRVF